MVKIGCIMILIELLKLTYYLDYTIMEVEISFGLGCLYLSLAGLVASEVAAHVEDFSPLLWIEKALMEEVVVFGQLFFEEMMGLPVL